MVCPRCIEAVRQEFEQLDLKIMDITLGRVALAKEITSEKKKTLQNNLVKRGFELLDDKQTQIISEIKSIIIQEVHYNKTPRNTNFSIILAKKMLLDYAYLSRLFSTVEGRTIENFFLAQKIEKVKELLTYHELSLSEIAFQLDYSSTAHLSSQFKKNTGMTPSAFRKLHGQKRQFLDDI